MHGKGAKSSAYGRILVGIDGSEGAREACKIERLGPDSGRELGFAGCMGRVQNRAFEAGFQLGSGGRMAHGKGAKSSAWGRILRVHGRLAKMNA